MLENLEIGQSAAKRRTGERSTTSSNTYTQVSGNGRLTELHGTFVRRYGLIYMETYSSGVSMNYRKVYDQIISRASSRSLEGYAENHHIVPRCIGGSDDDTNMVRLTAREHFVSHWLLYKIHKTSSLAYAWNAMCLNGSGQERYNSKSFEYARIAAGKAQSLRISGSGHHLYGKHHSSETRAKISEANRGLVKHSEEAKELRRQWVLEGKTGMLGMKHTEESKKKISDARRGKFGVPVIKTDLSGKTTLYSTAGIAMTEGYDSSSIIKCCKGKAKTHKKCTWRYAEQA